MIERSRSLRHSVAFLVLAVNIFTLAACSSGTGPTTMAPTLEPKNRAASSNYIMVDDPTCTGTCANEIAGINDSRDIVGNYTNCSGTSCNSANWNCVPNTGTTGAGCRPCPLLGGVNRWHSYTSTYNGGYSSFANAQYPDAPQGQYMYAISDRTIGLDAPMLPNVTASPPPAIEVGCINPFGGSFSGNGEENGYWALLDNNGLWSVHDQGDASGCSKPPTVYDESEELLGYDLSNTLTPTAVGFYSDQNCTFKAGEIQAGGNWNGIPVSLSGFTENKIATGITGSGTTANSGRIVGIATATSGSPSEEGWYIPSVNHSAEGWYVSGSTATAFTGIALVGPGTNQTVEIVGWYSTLTGTHGLVATPVGTSFSLSQTIDIGGGGLTMINGINSFGDICGWYKDSNGKYHGFVWLGKAATALRERHRHHSKTNYRNPLVSSVAVPVPQEHAVH